MHHNCHLIKLCIFSWIIRFVCASLAEVPEPHEYSGKCWFCTIQSKVKTVQTDFPGHNSDAPGSVLDRRKTSVARLSGNLEPHTRGRWSWIHLTQSLCPCRSRILWRNWCCQNAYDESRFPKKLHQWRVRHYFERLERCCGWSWSCCWLLNRCPCCSRNFHTRTTTAAHMPKTWPAWNRVHNPHCAFSIWMKNYDISLE